LQDLIKDVYAIVGPFSFERSDLHIQETLKNKIISNCKKQVYKNFGDYQIQKVEDLDGYKYYFSNDEWLMIRASGTEPVLRNYAESNCVQKTNRILKAAEKTLLGNNSDNEKYLGSHLNISDVNPGEARI
jgi:phosphomannomutase